MGLGPFTLPPNGNPNFSPYFCSVQGRLVLLGPRLSLGIWSSFGLRGHTVSGDMEKTSWLLQQFPIYGTSMSLTDFSAGWLQGGGASCSAQPSGLLQPLTPTPTPCAPAFFPSVAHSGPLCLRNLEPGFGEAHPLLQTSIKENFLGTAALSLRKSLVLLFRLSYFHFFFFFYI